MISRGRFANSAFAGRPRVFIHWTPSSGEVFDPTAFGFEFSLDEIAGRARQIEASRVSHTAPGIDERIARYNRMKAV